MAQRKFLDELGLSHFWGKLKTIFTRSKDVREIVTLTKAEYDTLPTKDPNTMYYVTDGEEGEGGLTAEEVQAMIDASIDDVINTPV